MSDDQYHHSHLFTVRLWPEEIDAGQVEWRGQVQHVPSGKTRYFRDWSTLVGHLLTMLPHPGAGQGRSGAAERK